MDKRKLAIGIIQKLQKNNFQAYFAGGCVRDMVMKKKPDDYDIATDATPNQIRGLFEKTVFVGAEFGTVLVVKDGISFEVTTFRGKKRKEFSKTPKKDVLNRDFTINGLLYDPLKKKLIDFCNGELDIKKRLIRCIANPSRCFKYDKLRLLRAIRFSAALGFKIEAKTFEAIKKFKDEIDKVSKERIRDELIGIMTSANPYRGMKLLDETGLLSIILPEMEALKSVEQPPKFHPEGDVFTHTMLLIKRLKNADTVLAFACLLHDIGKPSTYKKTDRIRFDGHDKVGAKLAQQLLKRLRFSNGEMKKIVYCVDNHMRVMNAMKMREATLKKLFLKDTFETELKLHKLDCIASHNDLKVYKFLKRRYEEFKKRPVLPKPILNGYEIMKMGFKEGPIIGKIQRDLVDRQLEGGIRTKGNAKEWVYQRWQRWIEKDK
ncbi:MAG: CCA tRNA nucleotidyltransferase [Candidatus Omnitrophica bacterium]|nr:CCA tRNA nucleotidyltransferase [Candidatus Omnitrophota bacterium]